MLRCNHWMAGAAALLLGFTVSVGLAQDAKRAANSPAAETAPAPIEVDAELIHRIKRFRFLYPEAARSKRKIASGLRDVLAKRMATSETHRQLFGYYAAQCAYVLGDLPDARRLIKGISADVEHPCVAEAIILLEHILCDELRKTQAAMAAESEGINIDFGEKVREYQKWRYKSIAALYPHGHAADTLMWFGGGSTPGVFPERRPDLMIKAGELYAAMGMWKDSIRAYRLAAGLLERSDWLSRDDAADIWRGLGDAYLALGKWRLATAYYYKAIACGGKLKELTPKLRVALNKDARREKATVSAPKPDATTLATISEMAAQTQLFEEAFWAGKKSCEIAGKTDSKQLAKVRELQAKTLRTMLRNFGEGRVFRGVKLSEKTVGDAERRAKVGQAKTGKASGSTKKD